MIVRNITHFVLFEARKDLRNERKNFCEKEYFFLRYIWCNFYICFMRKCFLDVDLSVLSFLIVIPTFILSCIKLGVNVSEDINNKITSFLKSCEQGYNNIRMYSDYFDRENKLPSSINCDSVNIEWIEGEVKKYKEARVCREKLRKIRRGFLYVYYAVFMVMLAMLLLHSELSVFLDSIIMNNTNLNIFTIWTLVLILLEISMKDIFEDFIFYCLEKKMGVNFDWY